MEYRFGARALALELACLPRCICQFTAKLARRGAGSSGVCVRTASACRPALSCPIRLHLPSQALNGGTFTEAIKDITGCVTEEVDTAGLDAAGRDRFFQELKVAAEKQALIGCRAVDKSDKDGFVSGILLDRIYAVVQVEEVPDSRGGKQRLLKIKNPWGIKEWGLSLSSCFCFNF